MSNVNYIGMENNSKKIKYFKVICKCGHVGRSNYIPITFAVRAYDGREAAFKARFYPRVKHDHKDAILFVEEISIEEFNDLLEMNGEDDYFKCTCKQEQNLIEDLEDRLVKDDHNEVKEYDKKERKNKVAYKQKKRREKENYSRFNYDYLECDYL